MRITFSGRSAQRTKKVKFTPTEGCSASRTSCGMDAVKADRARGDTMTDPSAEFFEELQRQGHVPLLKKVSGTLRFEVVNGKRSARWFITIKKGDVTVSRRSGQ